jgi:hypothetical protein
MNNDSIDLDLNLNTCALRVLREIKKEKKSLCAIKGIDALVTHAWYNGRERGVSIAVGSAVDRLGGSFVVVFGECRSSDQIFVDSYHRPEVPAYGEAPSRSDKEYEDGYDGRVYFRYNAHKKAAEHVVRTIRAWATASAKNAATKKSA